MNVLKSWLGNRTVEDDIRIMVWTVMIAVVIVMGWFWYTVGQATLQPICGCLSGSGDESPGPSAPDDSDIFS